MQKIHTTPIVIEIYRKSIHLLGIVIPAIYQFSNKNTMFVVILMLMLTSFIIDKLRIRFKLLQHPFFKKIGLSQIYREHEKNNFSALTFASIGMMLCLIISTKPVFILSVSILIFSDTAAAIFGMLFGLHKVNNKSIEGSAAFFLVACILSFVVTHIYDQSLRFLLVALAASLISTFVELFSKNSCINDNISIPISVSLIMWAFS
jgi:dolichol kinase